MLGRAVSSSPIIHQAQALAQSALYQANLYKEEQLEDALFFYGQAKVAFKYLAKTRQLTPSLSEAKDTVRRASGSLTAEDEALRQRIAEVYFERAQLLEQLGNKDKAQTSYQKAQSWGHPEAMNRLSIFLASSAPNSTGSIDGHRAVAAQILPSATLPATTTDIPPPLSKDFQEKNQLVNQLFTKILKTFQSLKGSNILPSAFLVYAHDNPRYGIADAGTAKFLIHHLGEVGINLYSDQKPKGQEKQASFSTREDAARLDDILTSQLCLLPTAIGSIQPVDKVIVCGSQVLSQYLRWIPYSAYCEDLKAAYGLAQQNTTQAEVEIRKVVKTYASKANFHHVLTEMAFLKIRTEYLTQHGIIPVSLCKGTYKSCFQNLIDSTTVRIEDMSHFTALRANGQPVYENQDRHLVFFKLLERLLVQHDAEMLLSTFWTGYTGWIKHLKNEKAVPKNYVRIWEELSEKVQYALQTLQTQVDAHELRTALTRYASLDRLAIQRLSGPPLSMKDCYINLAVVEQVKKVKEEKKPEEEEGKKSEEEEMVLSPFHRLPSAEAMDFNQQKLVPLEELFEPRPLSNGKTVTPKRILIRGRAGIGKTTLSKKIVYDYTQQGQWRDHFDWLVWIPLRTLKGKTHCNWMTLFYETYFQSHPKGHALAEKLAHHIREKARERTLFVLDGWDEVAQEWGEQEPMSVFLQELLNQPAVLVTSRPYVELKRALPMDLELETIGFSTENVTAYLDNSAIMPVLQAQQMKRFIQTNPFIQGLANVPIQLDALCYSWDEIKRLQQAASGPATVTSLYQAIMNKLWRKDILRLGKQEGGKLLTESQVNALQSSFRIEKLVRAEQNFLTTLAFTGLQRNQIEFHQRDLHAMIDQLEREGKDLPITLEANLKKLSFLHTDEAEREQHSSHFMHLTFQEFFAAKYFVQHWEASREITFLSPDSKRWTKAPPEALIYQHKYNPRYEIFWWFVAGLLREEALNRFFVSLEAEPRDLFGAGHQRLIANTLYEASRAQDGGLSIEIRDQLEQSLGRWLQLEINWTGRGTLAYQSTFPEQVLLQCLQHEESTNTKKAVTTAFQHWSALSEAAIKTLIAQFNDPDWSVRRAAADTLGKQTVLPESAFHALIPLFKELDKGIRRTAAQVLVKQIALPEEAFHALIDLTKDEDMDVMEIAAHALSQQTALPESALHTLIALIKESDNDVRYIAAQALGKQINLPEEALHALIALTKDENKDVKYAAAQTLGQQTALPEEALHALIALTNDKGRNVKCAAAYALGKQTVLLESALNALIALTEDWDRGVRHNAVQALGQQTALSEEVLRTLVALLKESDKDIMRTAAQALGQQTALPESTLHALIMLLKEPNWDVKYATAQVLGKQTALPESAFNALITLTKDEDRGVRRDAAQMLGQQPTLPESATNALVALIKESDKNLRHTTAQALGKQTALPESTLHALIMLLKEPNWDVKYAALQVLGQQTALPEEALHALIDLTKDEDEDRSVRERAVQALGQQIALPESALHALIALTKDRNKNVRRAAANTLGQQIALPESALHPLIALTKDRDKNVRHAAANTLSQQTALPESAIRTLVALLKESDKDIRHTAAQALSQQTVLPEEALHALIALMKDEDGYVRRNAAQALGRQTALPESAIHALIPLLKESYWDVTDFVTQALGQQTALPESAIHALIAVMKDRGVRRNAAQALGRQTALPESALHLLIALTKGKDEYLVDAVTQALGKNRWGLYRLLLTSNKQKIVLIYEYLLTQRFDQSVPFYIQEKALYFYTAEGRQTALLGDPVKFKQAIQHAQQEVGLPLASSLSTSVHKKDSESTVSANQPFFSRLLG